MQSRFTSSAKINRVLIGAVIASVIISFLRTPLLNGTFAGLVVTVILQLYLPGYLLARLFGKNKHPHPISRFAWVLACGLGLTITMGAIARFLSLAVPIYLAVLHIIMLVLALLPTGDGGTGTPWRLTRRAIPFYVVVAISCIVAMGVSYESRYRFYGFEDQPIFISLVDWIVYHPDIHPNDLPLRARQIGVLDGDSRMDTDGFSYNQAAWVWASGVSGAQLIWFDLATLFIWTVPLITFALAYEISGRESAGAWSAAGLVLVGLLMLDNIIYNPTYTAFGRYNLFQVNVLRQSSITFMLPLTLMTALSYLRSFRRRDLLITILAGLALAAMHPIQITIFILAAGATMIGSWLAKPTRANLIRLLPLALVIALMLALPFIQRLNRAGLTSAPSLIKQDALENSAVTSNGLFLVLRDLPILGTTYIRDPADVFYHPAITLTVLLGLAAGWWWRRNLAARYVFSTTLTAMILFFTPGLTELVNKFISSLGLLTTMFLIPVALIYGFTVDTISRYVFDRTKESVKADSKTASSQQSSLINWITAIGIVLVMGALLFEPFPIQGSARDQLTAYNDMQTLRRLHPAQEALSESLREHLPPDAITVVVTPYDVANVVIEDLPSTLITGGRAGRNEASDGNERFFTETPPYYPWLDTADLEFLATWGATHIITLADTTRLPQMLLQPDRFTLLDSPAGYTVFEIKPDIQADAVDVLYGRMNSLFGDIEQPRWGRDGFNLIVPGDADSWRPLSEDWESWLNEHPEDDRARLGLAFSYVMMGQEADALPLWRTLNEQYPDEILYADAVATILQTIDQAEDSTAPLMAALTSEKASTRILAARRLLTDVFFYRLNHEQLYQIFAVTEADAITWDRLANLGRADELRKRVALIMGVDEWAKAREWLDALPNAERAPEDLTAQAAAALAMGDVDGALAILRPATDDGQIAANVFLHGDRWEVNTAAQTYYLLEGQIAWNEDRIADAEAAFQQAIDYGSTIAGRNMLAQLWYSQQLGNAHSADRAYELQLMAVDEWAETHEIPYGPLLSLNIIPNEQRLYVMRPSINRDIDEQTLNILALFSNMRPFNAYPIRSWRIQVVSPDSRTTYAAVDVPAAFVEGALIGTSTDVTLPPDIPELTPALVYIEPRYNNAVTTSPAVLPLVLNRPKSAVVPAGAEQVDYQFSNDTGTQITLQAYQIERDDEALNVSLYWQTASALVEDYQVFIHVSDAEGQQVGGQDSAPVDNRYVTSQWREGVTIADTHQLTFDKPLPPGDYTVRIGLYRLSDGARLTITPADDKMQDNSLMISRFTVQ